MDKEFLAKVVGELYLNNAVFLQQIKDLQEEVARLKKLLDELDNGSNA